MSLASWLRQKVFGIRPRDMEFARMGARIDAEQAVGLQAILDSARLGFNVALADDRVEDLSERVARVVEPAFLGFAHEGAGMCLALLDGIRDRERVPRFFERCLGSYDFFVPLGVGFALARAPWLRGGVEARAARFPPAYDGLILNGYGFHEACFRSRGALERTPVPRGLSAAGARCLDHGIGRAVWFMCGGSPERIASALASFEAERREDLWAGLGTACAFAGRAHADEAGYRAALGKLDAMLGPYREAFEVGVVLAAELARRTRHPTRWVSQATQTFLGLSDVEAGAVAVRAWAEAHAEKPTGPFATYARFAHQIVSELSGLPGRNRSQIPLRGSGGSD
jgi:enediyne biosynthesis protein E3